MERWCSALFPCASGSIYCIAKWNKPAKAGNKWLSNSFLPAAAGTNPSGSSEWEWKALLGYPVLSFCHLSCHKFCLQIVKQ